MNKNVPKIKNESGSFSEERELLFRKGVSALIMNNKNKFLLVNLESFKNHFFAIPGGGIESKESLEDAVYREMQEELGIARQSLELIGVCKEPLQFRFKTKKLYRNDIEYDGSGRHFFGFKFIGNESDIKLQEGEIRSYKWVSYGDLKDYLLFDNQLSETAEKILELFPFVKENSMLTQGVTLGLNI
jgi:putative (di)nucleoside polyphosphate hydrolase